MLSEVFGESPWWSLTLYGITACGLYYLWATFQTERKIRALGGHTVILPSWIPFGTIEPFLAHIIHWTGLNLFLARP